MTKCVLSIFPLYCKDTQTGDSLCGFSERSVIADVSCDWDGFHVCLTSGELVVLARSQCGVERHIWL